MANKSKSFTFRLSEEEYFQIHSKAEKEKMAMSVYIRTSALKRNVVVIKGLSETNKELKAIGINLNQMAARCNSGKIKFVDLSETRDILKEIRLVIFSIEDRL